MDGFLGKCTDGVDDTLIGGKDRKQHDRQRLQHRENVAYEAGVSVQSVRHHERGGDDHQNEHEGKQHQGHRDLEIQNLASLLVDLITLVLLP